MKIGIEFISTIKIVEGIGKFTGGTNYGLSILNLIKNDESHSKNEVYIFLPESLNKQNLKEEYDIFFSENFEIIYVKNLLDCDMTFLDIIYFPQLTGSTLKQVGHIKKKHPHLNVYATMHDRQHNFEKFDWMDRFYFKGIQRLGIPLLVKYFVKKIAFNYVYNINIKKIDKLFTVSNFSMQRIISKKTKNINCFVQSDRYINSSTINSDTKDFSKPEYILFVSGGRPEKNLLRTLMAYCKFVKESHSEVKLKIVGIDSNTKKNILKYKKIDIKIIENNCEFLGYVDQKCLIELYRNSTYLVFTSKAEGYGLPIREAMRFGKPVLCSRNTSIPEVAGSVLKYVDPYNIDSIYKGFVYYQDQLNLKIAEDDVQKRFDIVKMWAEQDEKIFLRELLNS